MNLNLAEYQKNIVKQIKELLDNGNKFISLYGDESCGKSTIAFGVAELLSHDWMTFFINGIDSSLPPYSTWAIGTKVHSTKKLNIESTISFGVNFPPVPISFNFSTNINRSEQSFILSPSEESLLAGIKRQTGKKCNILFIADNYEQWDIQSQQFLKKIILYPLNLPNIQNISTLVISRKKIKSDLNFSVKNIPLTEIPINDIIYIVKQRHSSEISNIDNIIREIHSYTKNNLNLAISVIRHYNKTGSLILNFDKIISEQYKNLTEHEQSVYKILEPLSTIDSYFTENDVAFFINLLSNEKENAEFLAEEYITLAKKLMFITGEEKYYFINEQIKLYFKSQVLKKEKFYHRKFSKYLQEYHPEDYFNRGEHLRLSISTNTPKIIIETWQLYFLSYVRWTTESDQEDIFDILPKINSLINQLNGDLKELQYDTFNNFRIGYQSFLKYDYKEAISYLQSISPNRLIPASLVEYQTLLLLCYIQLAGNFTMITKLSEELYDIINDNNFCEDEQYCRAALVLLDVYIDKLNDKSKIRILQRRLIQIIQQHIYNPVFEELEACFNRKAALYYPAVIASRQTLQSIKFYYNHNNSIELYMALCNHLGNMIIAHDYRSAKQTLEECDKLLKQNKYTYPSCYKLENNRILLNYLINEKEYVNSQSKYLDLIKTTSLQFLQLLEKQEEEISYVIRFNYLGLSLLCNCNSRTIEKDLETLSQDLINADEYYQYFMHDLLFAYALIKNDIINAREAFYRLKSLDVPLLDKYKPIFDKRRNVQEKLLRDPLKIENDPIKYHNIIAEECCHIQDPSSYFFGRGFLLSDLQFLSF